MRPGIYEKLALIALSRAHLFKFNLSRRVKRRCYYETIGSVLNRGELKAMIDMRSNLSGAFPKDFLWGVATSAYQIEGAVKEGGRGASIWDAFSRRPGRIKNAHTADVACDHYHRFDSDFQIMKDLGLRNYRFSMAWPRIFPQGDGAPNSEGMEFYDRLVDSLLNKGIEPNCTLYHWDLPLALESKRGWLNRDTAERFAEYAAFVVDRYGDRIKTWSTINEPWVISNLGYRTGEMAPGYRDEFKSIKASHHILLAHGLAAQRIKRAHPNIKVGIVQILFPTYGLKDSKEDAESAEHSWSINSAWFLDPIFKGRYPEADQYRLDCVNTVVKGSDLVYIKQKLDFLGVNYYFRHLVSGRQVIKQLTGAERTGMDWEVYPSGLYDLLVRINRDYDLPPVYITENGAAYDDVISDDGTINDVKRIRFIYRHLVELQRAIAGGVDVRGYYLWSLLDNFEWAYGYTQRFGIVHVDYKTQERRLKRSAHYYGELARTGVLREPQLGEEIGFQHAANSVSSLPSL